MTTNTDTTADSSGHHGRRHVCDDCGWIGETADATVTGLPTEISVHCPDCDGDTHREYFGNPLPAEGTTLQTPVGFDDCPVCGTAGIFLTDEPGTCMCGAEFGGLSTTEIVTVPDRGEQDVLIRASEDDLRHKVFDYCDGTDLGDNPRRSLAYWRVNGTPRQTGPGRAVLFSTTSETVDYYAPICTAEEDKLWFAFLYPTRFEVPAEPPTRGFKYVDWGDWPW
ncbi:hypothetical protein [Natronorubrum texcoconense]|uniref:Uncharacterized protein n=1 Tax=Natronorubrum texcoconense TaxID=1095776 RepID=A0A1G9H9M3_9EURY|nr:hypothetical protein [Natronorubrum texcoconense]SDL09666.1 hypothetical protein SAMN04515672_0162 [Natronorubrum texcoconense]